MKMLFQKYLLFICIIQTGFASASGPIQFLTLPQNIYLSVNRGFIADGNKIYTGVINDYTYGVTVGISSYVNGSKSWHGLYNFPETGFLFHYENLNNPEQLGNIFSVVRYIDFNLFDVKNLDVDLKSFIGLAYATKRFDPDENYKNPFFSKPVNFMFGFDVNAEYPVLKQKNVYLNTGISLFHISNGETSLPNQGINNLNVFMGLYYRNVSKPNKNLNIEKTDKHFYITIMPTVGRKEYWRYGSDKFIELSLSSEFLYQFNFKCIAGLGIDFFYDETLKSYSNHNLKPVTTNKDAIFGGISLTYQVNLYPLLIVFKTGPKLFNTNDSFGTVYNLFGMKYYATQRFFISLFHRSHASFYGDNIQFGIGYNIIKY